VTLLRLLNVQGIAGIATSLCLAVLLILQKGETRHWRKQSGEFQQLYQHEHSAFADTVANYRAAAAQAEHVDRANAERVRAEQAAINQQCVRHWCGRCSRSRSAPAPRSPNRRSRSRCWRRSGNARRSRCPRQTCFSYRGKSTSCQRRPHSHRASHPARRADQVGPTAARGRQQSAVGGIGWP
jgi:hypothetical protein